MPNFQIIIEHPEEIIPRLGKQDLHWKKGRSAYELATAWMDAGGFPRAVKTVLDKHDVWRTGRLLEAIFERETEIPGKGRPSQTDLLALVALPEGNAIIGVEGKVDESFGPRVREWMRTPNPSNRRERLFELCETLGLDQEDAGDLYYQLIHRTCAAIYEGQRFRCKRALMLVHSFSPAGAWFEEFQAFARAVGMPVETKNELSPVRSLAGIDVQLGWVTDTPSAMYASKLRWELPEAEGVYIDSERGLWCSNVHPMLDEDENPPEAEEVWHQAKPSRGNLNEADWRAWRNYLESPIAADGLLALARLEALKTLRRVRNDQKDAESA